MSSFLIPNSKFLIKKNPATLCLGIFFMCNVQNHSKAFPSVNMFVNMRST